MSESKLTLQAKQFTAEYQYTAIDPLTIIAVIRLAITIYQCFSGSALLHSLRSKWGLGSWMRKRAIRRAIDTTADLSSLSEEDRKALTDDLDEHVADLFRSMPDSDALAFIDEAFTELGLQAKP